MARSSTPRSSPPDPAFAERWNQLDKTRRKQIRRLVRNGRQQENAADARLAVGFATYQRSRRWYRFFWLWFPVLVIAAVYTATFVHPLVVGMVLAVGANGLLVRRGFSRTERVNAGFLTEGGVPSAPKKERVAPSGITLNPRAKKRGKGTTHKATASS